MIRPYTQSLVYVVSCQIDARDPEGQVLPAGHRQRLGCESVTIVVSVYI